MDSAYGIYEPAQAGAGITFAPGGLNAAIMRRIEMLGKMNDKRLRYVDAVDGESLLRLADEYERKKMKTMARMIRKEVGE